MVTVFRMVFFTNIFFFILFYLPLRRQLEKMNRLKLPAGIHTFERIRTEGCVYVGKTKYLVDIIDGVNVCFLARPRRFGKSLTASTFEALSSGRRELFEGLYAEEFRNLAIPTSFAKSPGDVDEFVKVANRLLAKIPYDDFSGGEELTEKNKLIFLEKICRNTILSFLHGCGLNVFAEMHTNKGRSDLVFSHIENPTVWVVEIKIASKRQSARKIAQEALQKIKDNNYAEPFEDAICIGLAIKEEKGLITEWEVFPEELKIKP